MKTGRRIQGETMRVLRELCEGPMTSKEIGAVLHRSPDACSVVLKNHMRFGRVGIFGKNYNSTIYQITEQGRTYFERMAGDTE